MTEVMKLTDNSKVKFCSDHQTARNGIKDIAEHDGHTGAVTCLDQKRLRFVAT